jgi:hypothetical protein
MVQSILEKAKTAIATPCLEWKGSLDTSGYGLIRVGKSLKKVHRWAYETKVAPIPNGLLVLHHCDNRKCYNVEHLFLGTLQDNINDRNAKQRQARGERNRHKLKEVEVRDILNRPHAQACDLAAQYGVSVSTIYTIRKRKSWKHVS